MELVHLMLTHFELKYIDAFDEQNLSETEKKQLTSNLEQKFKGVYIL